MAQFTAHPLQEPGRAGEQTGSQHHVVAERPAKLRVVRLCPEWYDADRRVTSINAEDFELLDAWRAGDREAGNTLFERHFDAVCRFFANKVNDNVDDLIQKTFLGCIEGRDRFRKQSSFRTYLFAVAHNVLRMHFRSRPNDDNEPVDFTVTTVDELTPSPSAVFASHEEQRLLLEGLRHIPIESQMVLELYYWEDMPASELAEVMSIPEGTVRSRIRRAKDLLARRMKLLARSPDLLKTTMSDLEHWVRSLRERLSTDTLASESA